MRHFAFPLFIVITACAGNVTNVTSDAGPESSAPQDSSAESSCCGDCDVEQDVTVHYVRCQDAGGGADASPCLPNCYEACADLAQDYGSYEGCTIDPSDSGVDVTATCKFIRLCGI
jgi:hypothetical protein